ncbi:hypothetical protein [Mucilaginibacter aquatilis]|uniref:Uncharacterized protein n=1 Tax=Mucilaginibacter aquatilis TaxID=1517760 RepID=A0A6I4IB15_9SPHI|nr:hypothetical protein [Mucilaginibacter aquatilis]MVN92430.1 hypothetical protein [Mucilaginibacter aquatilis]
MKIFTQLKYTVLVVGLLAAVSSCRTYDNSEDVTPVNPGSGNGTDDGANNQNQVVITFPRTSVDINTTDSVVAVLSNGSKTIRKRATKGGTFYTISLNGVSTGTWSTNIKVYTSNSRMYRFETNLNTAVSSTFVGPTGRLVDNWKTNLFLRNADYGISFAVAALPTDAYYELFLPPTLIGYTHVYFDRYVYKVINGAENVVNYGALNFKAADYRGFQSNTTAFAPFATAMKDQPWDTADVSLQLYNEGTNANYKIIFQQTIKNEQ